MAGGDLGEGTRLAAARGAWICFEDEAGQTLRPPRARTWGPRGRTPVIRVRGKGSDRVSVAGLVCVKPGQPGRFFYRLRVHRHGHHRGEGRRALSEADYAALLTAAHRNLRAPMIVIWDNLNTHRTKAMRAYTQPRSRWLTLVWLPPYAPELNAAEGAWATMKHPLANRALPSIDQLAELMEHRLRYIQRHPQLINSFLSQTGLSLTTWPP